jgi:hypothetical protein
MVYGILLKDVLLYCFAFRGLISIAGQAIEAAHRAPHIIQAHHQHSLAQVLPIFELVHPENASPHKTKSNNVTPHKSCSCGTSLNEAFSLDCIWDHLALYWLPPHCRDDELLSLQDHLQLANGPRLAREFRTRGQLPNGEWEFHADEAHTIPFDVEAFARDAENGTAPDPVSYFHIPAGWHIMHCIYYWRKQFRLWGVPGRNVEKYVDSEDHITYCKFQFLRDVNSNSRCT